MMKPNRRRMFEKLKYVNSYSDFSKKAEINDDISTVQGFFDSEQLAEWVFDYLKQTGLFDNFSLVEGSYYRGSRNEKVLNRIEQKGGQWFENKKITFICNDGLIIIQLDNIYYKKDNLYWYYEDLTKQDAKQIAEFLESIIVESDSRFSSDLRDKTGINIERLLKNIIKKSSDFVIDFAAQNRLKRKISCRLLEDNELAVIYRENAQSNSFILCKFLAEQIDVNEAALYCLNDKDEYSKQALDHIEDADSQEDEIRDFVYDSISRALAEEI